MKNDFAIITMTVLCDLKNAEAIKSSLDDWYYEHDMPLYQKTVMQTDIKHNQMPSLSEE